jgi:2-polyprenyl-6-methoxyphenol hydroxylase-like FAD-dependent oxidoreductase
VEPPVLIVGGGIAGLTLATALHRRGIPAEIVERRPAWPTEGAAITLHANGVRVLRSLGLGGALDRVSEGLAGWTFCDEHAEPLCRTDLEELWGEATPCRGVTRVRLQQVLLAGAAEVPHRLGVAVVGLAQEHGRASVAFSDGSRGEYGLVVGADGIRSTVRRLAVSSAEPRYAGTMTWRSVIPARPGPRA